MGGGRQEAAGWVHRVGELAPSARVRGRRGRLDETTSWLESGCISPLCREETRKVMIEVVK